MYIYTDKFGSIVSFSKTRLTKIETSTNVFMLIDDNGNSSTGNLSEINEYQNEDFPNEIWRYKYDGKKFIEYHQPLVGLEK